MRLVEQEHIGFAEQHLRQFDAHAPSAGKFAGLPVEVLALESEAEECFLHIFLKVRHVDGIELFAFCCHLFNQRHVFVAFVVGAFGQLAVERFDFGFHLVQVGKGLRRFFENGASVLSHEVLGQVGNDRVLGGRYRAAGGLAHTGQDFQQGALACTVLAHEGDAVFFVDDKGNVTEEGGAAEFNGKSVN